MRGERERERKRERKRERARERDKERELEKEIKRERAREKDRKPPDSFVPCRTSVNKVKKNLHNSDKWLRIDHQETNHSIH